MGVTSRTVRPRSSSSDFVPRTAGMIEASQAIRRTVSGASNSPLRVVPAPVRSCRSGPVHRHHHRGLRGGRRRPARGGSTPADLDQRVRAALVAGAEVRPGHRRRVVGRPAGRGSPRGRPGPRGPAGAGTRSSRHRRMAGTGERPCLSRSSRRWNSPHRPYLAISRGRSARIWAGPSSRRSRRTRPAPSPRTPGSDAQQLVHLGQRDRGVADRDPRGQYRLR